MLRSFILALLAACPVAAAEPVFATVESSLATAGGQIRQFAFDGDDKTWFASEKHAGKNDTFTLIFDKPVTVKSAKALTGKPGGGDALEAGTLEASNDGKAFAAFATFQDGSAEGKPNGKVKAIRLRVSAAQDHPLAIREFAVNADPPVAAFKYPVEFTLDVADAPEMKPWAEKVIHVCERQYYMINEELKSDGFTPRTLIHLAMKKDYKGVAECGGGRIRGSVDWFTAHPEDIGAFVHETAHAVQNYRSRGNPGWLVEGIADYVRFYKYEAAKPKPLRPQQAKFDGSYRTTAAFLDFVVNKYDKEAVRKLNAAMREGEYSADLFKAITKKTLPELDEEWKQSLRK